MTSRYTPRPGSYPAKAIEVLLPLEGKMLASGALARLIGCNVKHVHTVLAHALGCRAIATQRTQSGNWYGIGDLYADQPVSSDDRAEAAMLVRQLPASSVFDLGAPPRVLPLRNGREPRVKTMIASKARFSVWDDGGIRIDRGELSLLLTPAESRELVALASGKAFEGVIA